MKKLNLDLTIGESVTTHPELVKLFMDYNVDFCCGGDRNLISALKEDGADVEIFIPMAEDIINKLILNESGNSVARLSELSTEVLINRILKLHHGYLKAELPEISNLMFKTLRVHSDHHPELFELHSVFGALKTELESHMVKEENQLFPALLTGDTHCKDLIGTLESEHDSAGDALHEMTEITEHFKIPDDACATYVLLYDKLKTLVADMYMHVHTENNVLFKRFI